MSYRTGVVPNYEPVTGRCDMPLHSVFMDSQEIRSLVPQIKRHEIRLTEAPQDILEFFFTKEEIMSAAYLRHNAEESVPFYLIRLHPEIRMKFSKRKIMNKIFKDPLKREKYAALIDFGLFHDEIIDCLAQSNHDFKIAVYKLLNIKKKRAEQVRVLRRIFTDEEVIDAMEETEDWCEVVYKLMSDNPKQVTPLSLQRMDQHTSKYNEDFQKHGYLKFFLCLYEFGFIPKVIVANWLVCSDWEVLPYNLLTKIG